ncbi:MAG: hypothetical protein JWN52_7410 [Actinomycetia bacterium]|nr:hypothetical protein [Actinomycetes bacterium]
MRRSHEVCEPPRVVGQDVGNSPPPNSPPSSDCPRRPSAGWPTPDNSPPSRPARTSATPGRPSGRSCGSPIRNQGNHQHTSATSVAPASAPNAAPRKAPTPPDDPVPTISHHVALCFSARPQGRSLRDRRRRQDLPDHRRPVHREAEHAGFVYATNYQWHQLKEPHGNPEVHRPDVPCRPHDPRRALGLGRTKAYELAQHGQFPCRVIKIGDTHRIPTPELLRLLGALPDPGPPKPK